MSVEDIDLIEDMSVEDIENLNQLHIVLTLVIIQEVVNSCNKTALSLSVQELDELVTFYDLLDL